MTPQEKDLITELLGRLPPPNEPKDPEADALIQAALRQRPDATYFLVQTVLIQEMALAQAQQRLQDLERQLAAAQAAQQSQQQPTSFLGRALRGSAPASGPWGPAPSAPQTPPGGVWSQSSGAAPAGAGQPFAAAAPGYPAPGYAAPWAGGGGGGFLRQAAMTAAGVAGGALLFEGIQSMFGHGSNVLGGMAMQPGLSETVVNNYYGDQSDPGLDSQQADYQPDDPNAGAGQDFADNQDFGSDPGGGDGGNFDV
jgi:hypothetical protein